MVSLRKIALVLMVVSMVVFSTALVEAQNYNRFSVGYVHTNIAEFNAFIKNEVVTEFSDRGIQIGYHYIADSRAITNLRLGLGANLDVNFAKRKGLFVKTNVYLIGAAIDVILDYVIPISGFMSIVIGVNGGVSAIGYLRMKLLKSNMWRYYWDIEPHMNLSFDIGFIGSIYVSAGYHFKNSLGDWMEGTKKVKSSDNVLKKMGYFTISIGLNLSF